MSTITGFDHPIRAAVIGASGGIGGAFLAALAADDAVGPLLAFSRSGNSGDDGNRVHWSRLDTSDEASVEAAASTARDVAGELDLVLVATGKLHDGDDVQPEKSFRHLDGKAMLDVYQTNSVGPALVAKHFLPLMPRRGRAIFAAISARVGSIGDNELGGWHSYRASKAALNMLIKNFAIEIGRRNQEAIIVGLHPGTVASVLSAPFQAGVPKGKLFKPAYSAARMLETLDKLRGSDSGAVYAYDGMRLPW